jgi:hypothetical protein
MDSHGLQQNHNRDVFIEHVVLDVKSSFLQDDVTLRFTLVGRTS